jgi:UDP-4-amino-4,6-dideoxy-N-acetyl-beta-L-altrosamine transaminase
MKISKPMLDTNILVYAHNQDSPFFLQASSFIEELLNKDGFCVTSLILLEFFSIITDGRKIETPLLPDAALEILEDIIDSDKIDRQISMDDPGFFVWLKDYIHITKRYQIYDASIAFSMHQNEIDLLYTNNVKDFKWFENIKVVNPFKKNDYLLEDTPAQFIPYGRQSIDEKDVAAVCSVLRSDYLTTGPRVEEFETSIATYTGAAHAVAVSSGTAALHCAMHAIGVGPGDEVIVPAMTFAATANCVVYQGGVPVFADVEPDTLHINPEDVREKITSRTKAVIAVDYAGQPCDYDRLRQICSDHNLFLVADACHSLGAIYKGRNVGTLADLTVFSFHPVKHITTGEGGMVTTNDPKMAGRMRRFRNHGITTDYRQREAKGSWFYEMADLGLNYRLTDFQCALGMSQLKKLPGFLSRRWGIAGLYDKAFESLDDIIPLAANPDIVHAYHLYVVKINKSPGRDEWFHRMRAAGIGVNVHYIPVYFHPFYQHRYGYKKGICSVAESTYEQILSLPIWPRMSDEQITYVIQSLRSI